MSRASRAVALTLSLCCASVAAAAVLPGDAYDGNDERDPLRVEGFADEDVKEPPHALMKCYDDETKTAYKIDSVWYPEGKCEKRVCSRQTNSKTPRIKTMTCEPCATCDLPNHTCHPFKAEKNYPKCCPKCLMQHAVYRKTTDTKKKHDKI